MPLGRAFLSLHHAFTSARCQPRAKSICGQQGTFPGHLAANLHHPHESGQELRDFPAVPSTPELHHYSPLETPFLMFTSTTTFPKRLKEGDAWLCGRVRTPYSGWKRSSRQGGERRLRSARPLLPPAGSSSPLRPRWAHHAAPGPAGA